jgi:uncharacterized membrane protein YqiK
MYNVAPRDARARVASMHMEKQQLFIVIGAGVVVMFGTLLLVVRCWRQVPSGKALIVKKMGTQDRVTFGSGAVVLPFVNQAEVMDLAVKTFEVECRGVASRDDVKVDIDVTFYVRVNATVDDVLKVAQSVGCARASDQSAVDQLFRPKFTEAILTVAAKLAAAEMKDRRSEFKDNIIEVIGKDLNGFVLDDAAIDRIEPAAMDYTAHDPDGRGRVERDGTDEVAKLRRDVDALQKQVAVLVDAWRKS